MNGQMEKDASNGWQGGQELSKWKRGILRILASESDSEETEEVSLQNYIKTLDGEWLIKQIPLLLVIAIFFVVMTTCRYQWQQQVIEKGDLQKEIEDATIRLLVLKSELTEKTRQSYVVDRLRTYGDTTLLPGTEAAYIINISQTEE